MKKYNSLNRYIELPKDNTPLLLIGNVFDWLKIIPPNSISCVVTSPPYWNLRDYYIPEQIGREKTPEEYIEKMLNVSSELLRILKRDGAYFLNIGDTYIEKGLQMIPQRLAFRMINDIKIIEKNKKKVGWLLRNQIIWYKPNHMPSPTKTRLTNTYEPIFFFSRDDWEKKVYFDIDKIRVPHKTCENGNNYKLPEYLSEEEYKVMLPKIEVLNKNLKYNGKFKNHQVNLGASPGGRSSITGIKYIKKRKYDIKQSDICNYLRQYRKKSGISTKELDKILGYAHTASHWFRSDAGGSIPTPEDWIKLKEILKFDGKYDKQVTEMHYVFQKIKNYPNGKNPGDYWENNAEEFKGEKDIWKIRLERSGLTHFSIFPEELPKRAILSTCPPDGIVLDPFAGSGTTGKIAKELNIKSILIDIQPDFIDIIKERCKTIKVIYYDSLF